MYDASYLINSINEMLNKCDNLETLYIVHNILNHEVSTD